jgi:hypothetical protein
LKLTIKEIVVFDKFMQYAEKYNGNIGLLVLTGALLSVFFLLMHALNPALFLLAPYFAGVIITSLSVFEAINIFAFVKKIREQKEKNEKLEAFAFATLTLGTALAVVALLFDGLSKFIHAPFLLAGAAHAPAMFAAVFFTLATGFFLQGVSAIISTWKKCRNDVYAYGKMDTVKELFKEAFPHFAKAGLAAGVGCCFLVTFFKIAAALTVVAAPWAMVIAAGCALSIFAVVMLKKSLTRPPVQVDKSSKKSMQMYAPTERLGRGSQNTAASKKVVGSKKKPEHRAVLLEEDGLAGVGRGFSGRDQRMFGNGVSRRHSSDSMNSSCSSSP